MAPMIVIIAPYLVLSFNLYHIERLKKIPRNKFAINKDEKAPIFKTAHYCLVGDLYDVIPQLIQKIEEKKGA